MTYEDILKLRPYDVPQVEKDQILLDGLKNLTTYHRSKCSTYDRILSAYDFDSANVKTTADIPFLPVRLFKELELKSISPEETFKVMTSSGTTGQQVSKIFLDRETAANQQKTLAQIVSNFTGKSRLPMIIIDCPSVVKNRAMFSARGAGILGFSIFGRQKIYALDDDMNLQLDAVREFLSEHENEKILLFGFTFMIWQHFYKKLKALGEKLSLENAVLIHGGGWKKLASEAVSPNDFKSALREVCGIQTVCDYYGMVEQTGCIYMECEHGHLHASTYSDVIMRRTADFKPCEIGEPGIIEVVSLLPKSYPGHALLTEDEGILLGVDDCPCGRKGKYFQVLGRIKNAELRGCSDTYAAGFVAKDQTEAKIDFLAGSERILDAMPNQKPWTIFSETPLTFLQTLSEILRRDPAAAKFPDVVTFAFWIRKAALKQMSSKYDDGKFRLGRGLTFHIAPSNVPVNFAYSMASAILAGNSCVVRVPSKNFWQVEIICRAVNEALEKVPEMQNYLALVRYGHEKEINDRLSKFADVRIIWGGDKTIEEIRRSPIPVKGKEIVFADRYSAAVIDSDSYLQCENKNRLAGDFFNDTYLNDQNACTSPRLVMWLGKNVIEAQKIFWDELAKTVQQKQYDLQPVQAVDKLVKLSLLGSKKNAHRRDFDNYVTCVEIDKIDSEIPTYFSNSGYFLEYTAQDISEILPICGERLQTVSYYGVDKSTFETFFRTARIKGIDRIVPIGRTLDFSLVWDGYDLIREMSREINL